MPWEYTQNTKHKIQNTKNNNNKYINKYKQVNDIIQQNT